jgi:hypothetical protein
VLWCTYLDGLFFDPSPLIKHLYLSRTRSSRKIDTLRNLVYIEFRIAGALRVFALKLERNST